MTSKEADFKRERELFRLELSIMVDHDHALIKLAGQIDWDTFISGFGSLYAEGKGHPSIPIRLMVGLNYLKHTFNLSNEQVIERWVENPYWQYFCGKPYFMHRLPIDPSQMTRFRKRSGAGGCETMLKMTIQASLASKPLARVRCTRGYKDSGTRQKPLKYRPNYAHLSSLIILMENIS